MRMRSFVKTKSSRNGTITLSFTDEGKSYHSRDFFLRREYVFNAIRENEILAKISEFTVSFCMQGAPCCDVMVTNYTVEFSEDGQKWKEYEHGCTKRVRNIQ